MPRRPGPTLTELLIQALSSTRGGYDRLAPRFDHTPFRTPDDVLAATAAHHGAPVARGLYVCCGTGAETAMLRAQCTERVVGVDFSRGMLDVARRRTASAPGRAALSFVRADALELPFFGGFDLAVSFGAFGHFRRPEQPRLLAGIRRALRPGGRFVFVTGELGARDAAWWVYRAFNGAMRIRNRLIRPRFVMYYLNFPTGEALARCDAAGLPAVAVPLGLERAPRLRIVTAVRRG